MMASALPARLPGVATAIACAAMAWGGFRVPAASAAQPASGTPVAAVDDDDDELARKADILHGPQWQRAVAELGGWLRTQTVYPPAEVRRIKARFNDRVAGMSSYELEYLLDSIEAKMRLLDSPEARDAKAWLGEYLAAMSDGRRAQAMRNIPDITTLSADQLWKEIERIDSLRGSLRERQRGVESRQATLAASAAESRQATAAASRTAAARSRAAPSHSPYRSRGGKPPFSDVPQRRRSIGVGPMGAFVSF